MGNKGMQLVTDCDLKKSIRSVNKNMNFIDGDFSVVLAKMIGEKKQKSQLNKAQL